MNVFEMLSSKKLVGNGFFDKKTQACHSPRSLHFGY
jgi:hypothetical protein